jgi:hypothetical protein
MLLDEVKDYIKTDDEDADVLALIERGKGYLSRKIGTVLDFEENDLPKQLLLDYCRYTVNNALEFFTENFAADILFLSLQEAIKLMESEVII